MYQIIDKHDSYYEFVVAVSQRARDIAEQAEKEEIILVEKPVKLAVEEFASGKVKVSDYI
ncbi:DNA-directed RNA polymerase subunit omega [Ruminococcaceae bacterium OttesenSCG-928-L11]|nr:DNA-directed RNA polymerase subunit omega [Ruminococcaceae bacterium OttesenSCG-928-L11]